ncbi:Cupin domain-containing protein [Lishizhenia tianjinensis]|uniref:Cupin domain-containing protein n=1 Tax=Lishizhenia tianjinensis TaxID=477690 RepID=A0A1I6Y8Q0_9FLAO|nr:cupin domain-containing protein [Lishizhenia tianjinensis]SFT46889.1 Cupin domain-containing protein [Lishizhenia tianjinensis]
MKGKIKYITLLALIIGACTHQKEETNISTDKHASVAQHEDIWPLGQKGSAEFFTGDAYHYPLHAPDSIYNSLVGNVVFHPTARSNWHTHPGGQILIITAGKGYHQIEGQPVDTLHKGDVVHCPPNTRHWHGAAPDSSLYQMYIVPKTDLGIVNWQEVVTDKEYYQQ